jgi:hypothetical protein
MFTQKTVFILGAGASWHYGYPTGEDLVTAVRDKAEQLARFFQQHQEESTSIPEFVRERIDGNLSMAWNKAMQESQNLANAIRFVNPPVIDYFLGHNPDLQAVGKFMIAWVIRECETQSDQRRTNLNRKDNQERIKAKDDWYRFVFHRLVIGCDHSENLLENKINFVTFNYDVSIESYIERALKLYATLFHGPDIDRFLGGDRFLHVYGKIRAQGIESFKPIEVVLYDSASRKYWNDPVAEMKAWKILLDDLYESSKTIYTIGPVDKATDKYAIARAREVIDEASSIYIMGFGFDPENSNRLELNNGLRFKQGGPQKHVMFTNFGNVNRVNKAMSKLISKRASLFQKDNSYGEPEGDSCHERSIRNCYDALSMDFDDL